MIAFFCVVSAPILSAQQTPPQEQDQQQPQPQQPQDQQDQQPESTGGLSAEQIIQILQENPDLLSEAKAQIASTLQARGYPVTENDITDDRLFSQIRSDDRVRAALSDELMKRGFAPEGETQAGAQKPPATRTRPSSTRAPSVRTPPTGTTQGKPAAPATPQKYYPYRNMPGLQELYTQAVPDTNNVERFGAALFRNSTAAADKAALDVPVGPDYVIGPGDQLVVDSWGSVSQRLQLTVDRQGQIGLPEVGMLMVAGHSLGDAEVMIQRAMSQQYRDVTVNVSLGKLRTVRVYVVGDVVNPGAYDISALSTPLSALLAAGGPTDKGSLRTVKHYRGKRLVEEDDLYDLMLKGVNSAETRIESGDSILVPPAGPQVTVAGVVRRPAIYELRQETTLAQALELAGGVLVSGELGRIKVERIEAHQRKEMLNVNLPPGGDNRAIEAAFGKIPVQDGDRVTVSPILSYTTETVYLQGHVFRPGKYPYRQGLTVADLITSFQDLMPEPADRAEIVRLRPPDNRPYVIAFNVRDMLEKRESPLPLEPFDTVHIFGRYESDAPKVAIYGEVLRPGEYPLSERMTAAALVALAGGFKRSAYTTSADLSSYEVVNGDHVELEHREIPIGRATEGDPDTDVVLKAGDVLTISQLGGWTNIGGAITVSGEVLHPGRYGIQEGERLSSILRRAGGFTEEAYPFGAVLERTQVREMAVKNRDELVRKLQSQQFEGTAKPENPAGTAQREALISNLKKIQPSGRMVVRISARIEEWENTPADIEVRSGDVLVIPKTPNFILVAGQVYNPTAISYAPGHNAGWYLKQAGGPTDMANKKDIFVVRANGAVVGKDASAWWTGGVLSTVLQPGDTVYVPEKIQGGDKLKTFGQIAQIMSGLAIAASVAVNVAP
ncbi:MAG TPA: SLBB domain-containing protein [Terriglobales bacterium]|nr:SLBB domain-containing protein [Terriglobales bacterium]